MHQEAKLWYDAEADWLGLTVEKRNAVGKMKERTLDTIYGKAVGAISQLWE